MVDNVKTEAALDVLLETDAYKLGHRYMYVPDTTVVYSNLTARGTRNPHITEGTVFFGLQAFLHRLTEKWQVFFDLDAAELDEVLDGYETFVNNLLGPNRVGGVLRSRTADCGLPAPAVPDAHRRGDHGQGCGSELG